MKRKILAALFCMLIASLLQGCQLARENAGSGPEEDRLIGVFITTEYLDLFDFERYLNDNLNRFSGGAFSGGEINMNGDAEKYQGRLYATLTTRILTNEETGEQTETQDYVFEDIEGIPYFVAAIPATFSEGDSIGNSEGNPEGTSKGTSRGGSYVSLASDEAISNGHMSIAERDEGKTTTLEGTIYVLPLSAGVYYPNPVYQSADGRVYLTSEGGISASGVHDEGLMMSQTLSADYTVTENGRTQTDSFSITIAVSVLSAPEKIVILQMDADSTVLSKTIYAPDEMPEAFAPDFRTEYILVETHKRGADGEQKIQREVFGSDAEAIEYFIVREDGICQKRPLQIEWAHQEAESSVMF